MSHILLEKRSLTILPKPCRMSLSYIVGFGPGGSAWGVD
jgi:hypothetical protein